MTDSLEIARFRHLAECYGADIARWPAEIQDAARRTATAPMARAILDEAGKLDAILDLWPVDKTEQPIAQRAIAMSTKSRPEVAGRLRLWWASIGLAAALTGLAAGSLACAALSPLQPPYNSTVFGDVAGED